MAHEADDFLLGGTKAKSCTFPTIGTTFKGEVLRYKMADVLDIKTKKPLTWDNGDPQRQMIITLQTDEIDPEDENDSGLRNLYVKGQMKQAVAEALFKGGVKSMDAAIGGTLAVRYAKDGVAKTKGFNAPKLYEAVFKPGAPKQAVDDFNSLLDLDAEVEAPVTPAKGKVSLTQMDDLLNSL